MRWPITILATIFLVSPALANPSFFVDPSGNFYKSWLESESSSESKTLKYEKSIDYGSFFSPPKSLFVFSQEVESYDLKTDGQFNFVLAYESSGEIYYTISTDGGINFSPPLIISESGRDPVIAVSLDNQAVIWKDGIDNARLNYRFPANYDPAVSDLTFSLNLSGEVASRPTIAFDPLGHLHLACTARDEYSGKTTLYHFALLPTLETSIIYESFDQLSNLGFGSSPWGMVIFWQNAALQPTETFFSHSFDYVRHFGKPVALPLTERLLDFGFFGNRWLFISGPEEIKIDSLTFPAPNPPELIYPPENFISPSGSSEITYRKGTDPAIIKIDIARDPYFSEASTYSFDLVDNSNSPEATYPLPLSLSEATYYIRLSSFNGFATSTPSFAHQLKIDKTPPLITLTAPSEEVVEEPAITIAGTINELVPILINNLLITPEATGSFKAIVILNPGSNLLCFSSTDEAGNSTSFPISIRYSNLLPEIEISKPADQDWYKAGSLILIKATVKDDQGDIPDEEEATVSISGIPLEDKLSYDKLAGELSGFITLPLDLAEGKIPAEIKLKDGEGNTGRKSFALNIDQSSPVITNLPDRTTFSNSVAEIKLPLADQGSGVDPSGTMVTINGVSCEAYRTSESGGLLVRSTGILMDGSYEVEIIPRDLVGNTGSVSTLNLIIDSLPPHLCLLSSYETLTGNDKISIQASADDPFFSEFKVYNNQCLVISDRGASGFLSCEVPLSPGNNRIEIQAWDKAGNYAVQTFSVSSALAGSALFFNQYQNGPNPFSLARDHLMYFTFNLSASADVDLSIFDLLGALIYKKVLTNAAAGNGNLTWDGVDQFGTSVDNGIYLYLLRAHAPGGNEIKKGKIIVYQ
jgi:hypothetical protein